MAVMPLKSLATKKTKSVPLLSEEVRLPEMMWRGHDVREEEEEEESRYSRMGGGMEGGRGLFPLFPKLHCRDKRLKSCSIIFGIIIINIISTTARKRTEQCWPMTLCCQ